MSKKTKIYLFTALGAAIACIPALGIASTDQLVPSPQPEGYLDLIKVFKSCPIIYTLLILMSLASMTIWTYSMITLRLSNMMPNDFIAQLRKLFLEKQYDTALSACEQQNSFAASLLSTALLSRKHGPQVMMESIKSEGRRAANSLWQRLSLLNEISVIAPMLGLLGTVVGLFFAFYDSSRSLDSITSVFDGLGIAIGTTVVGLVVSILSMIFYTTLKFRMIGLITTIENESLDMVRLIEIENPSYNSLNRE